MAIYHFQIRMFISWLLGRLMEFQFLFSKEGRGASALDWILYLPIVIFTKHPCKCGWTQREPASFLLGQQKSHWRGGRTLTWCPWQCCKYINTQIHVSSCPLSLKIGHGLFLIYPFPIGRLWSNRPSVLYVWSMDQQHLPHLEILECGNQ